MFASIGAITQGVAVKCATVQDALNLEDLHGWPKAPYFHRSWVLLPLDLDESDLRHRIETSYRIMRNSLTQKAQAELAPFRWGLADSTKYANVAPSHPRNGGRHVEP